MSDPKIMNSYTYLPYGEDYIINNTKKLTKSKNYFFQVLTKYSYSYKMLTLTKVKRGGIMNYKLKAIRVANHETQEDLSKVIGTSEATYRLKEKGCREFSEKQIKRIKDHYNLLPEELNRIFFGA